MVQWRAPQRDLSGLIHQDQGEIPMCLAAPKQVTAVCGLNASCEARGMLCEISLLKLQHGALAEDSKCG